MTRIAFISDIHGNLHALRAVLADIDACGVDEIVCLGDTIGYGPAPGACLDLVEERCVASIRGNHEDAVLVPDQARMFNPHARAALDWTSDTIEERHVEAIGLMPTWIKRGSEIICVHDAPVPVEDPGYLRCTKDVENVLASMQATWCFIGHTHIPAVFAHDMDESGSTVRRVVPFPSNPVTLESGSRYILNPGSVGQPRDGDWRASWALLELDDARFTINRIGYEVSAVAEAINTAGLPRVLGSRLRIGA